MLAMRLISNRKEKNFIIFSDSMSSLQALNGFKLELDIPGNEKADCAAKSALSLPITNI